MPSSKAEWVGVVLAGVVLCLASLKSYDTYIVNRTIDTTAITQLKKEMEGVTAKVESLEDEVEELTINTYSNTEAVAVIREDQERNYAVNVKLAEAVENLTVAVGVLNERTK